MAAFEAQLDKLAPFIASQPDEKGEVDLYCPLHNDTRRSAQLNVKKGIWFCHSGCGGGHIDQLIEAEGYWIPPEGRVQSNGRRLAAPKRRAERITEHRVHQWHRALMRDEDGSRSHLHQRRGLKRSILRRYLVGWDSVREVFTIPIRTARGRLANVRRYDPKPGDNRRKIWGIRGANGIRPFPAAALARAVPGDEIIICEGEWDALLTIQNGFRAMTRTGAAHTWDERWDPYFEGLDVYLCHDRDRAGELGNRIVARHLEPVAKSVSVVELPGPFTEKNGYDLTDYFTNGGSPDGFASLMERSRW